MISPNSQKNKWKLLKVVGCSSPIYIGFLLQFTTYLKRKELYTDICKTNKYVAFKFIAIKLIGICNFIIRVVNIKLNIIIYWCNKNEWITGMWKKNIFYDKIDKLKYSNL